MVSLTSQGGTEMQKYNMYEAKTNFSKIINLVEHNEEVLISRNGKPVTKIIPFVEKPTGKRKFGTLRGKIKVNKDFDKPLPEDLIDSFYSGKL